MSYMTIPPFLLKPLRTPLLAIAVPVVLGSLSGVTTYPVLKKGWYQALKAPAGKPPQKAFPVVWTALYAGMGYASYLAIRVVDANVESSQVRKLAYVGVGLYYAQLGLNLLWTPLFFGMRQRLLALVDIVALTGTVVTMTVKLHEATEGATTWFLAPYCGWLGYATYLNAGYWWLNRQGQTAFDKRD